MKISVVTISYNDLDGLHETLVSIARQTAQDVELIVVDGGSSDGTAKLLEDMDDIVDAWVSEPDGGIYDAMNKGVSLATGDYLNFMNAGDCFHDPKVLERVLEVIGADAPPLFAGHAYARGSHRKLRSNDALWKGMVCSHQATISRRDLHLAHPFSTDLAIAADYRFFVECEAAGVPIRPVDLDVAIIDTGGVSFVNFEARTHERMQICREFYPRKEVYEYFRNLLTSKGYGMPPWAGSFEAWINGET